MRSAPLLFVLALAACGQPPATQLAEPASVDSLSTPDNGKYTETMPDGTRLQGAMRDGKRVDIWRSFSPDGKMRSQTEYKAGNPH